MRRSELSRALAARLNISRRFADQAVGELFELLADELAAGASIDIRGFGRFDVRTWPARVNPVLGGGRKLLPERKYVKFKMADALKTRVRAAAGGPPR